MKGYDNDQKRKKISNQIVYHLFNKIPCANKNISIKILNIIILEHFIANTYY